MIVASLVAFWCGEFVNSFVMAKMKILTGGRHLWTRTIGSTAAGQAVDTCVVMIVAFAGKQGPAVIVNLILSGYFGKVLYEVLPTPLTSLILNKLKRSHGIDPLHH